MAFNPKLGDSINAEIQKQEDDEIMDEDANAILMQTPNSTSLPSIADYSVRFGQSHVSLNNPLDYANRLCKLVNKESKADINSKEI